MNDFKKMIMSQAGVGSLNGLYDIDTVKPWLEKAGSSPFTTIKTHTPEKGEHSYRFGIRSLAAVMPGRTIDDAALRIHMIVNNPDLTVLEVKEILKGNKREVPFKTLQQVGELISEGKTYVEIAEQLQMERKTVAKLDAFLGMTVARDDKLISIAISLEEDGLLSVRKFATLFDLTESHSRKIIKKARQVIKELA